MNVVTQRRVRFVTLKHLVLPRAARVEGRIAAWTVNGAADIDRLLDMGIDAIISDYPERVKERLEHFQTHPRPPADAKAPSERLSHRAVRGLIAGARLPVRGLLAGARLPMHTLRSLRRWREHER